MCWCEGGGVTARYAHGLSLVSMTELISAEVTEGQRGEEFTTQVRLGIL